LESERARRALPPVRVLVATYGAALLLMALTIVGSVAADVPLSHFTRDPVTTLRGHVYTGVQSHVGVLVWWAAAAVSFFAAVVVKRARHESEQAAFLVWSAVITSVLALDDLFLFHEQLAPKYLRVHQKLVIVAYGFALIAYLVEFRRTILGTEYALLAAALVLFALSSLVDFFEDHWRSGWRIFVEDGFKLLGIVSWSGYLIRAAHRMAAAGVEGDSPKR
jgi:hypothetical protein